MNPVMDFRWVVADELAGASLPGLWAPLPDDLDRLRKRGIGVIVTLTEAPLPADAEEQGFARIHFPIVDMGVPTPRAMLELCQRIEIHVAQGRPAAVHCRAGLGRTGTVLASMLISRGASPEGALRAVRIVQSGYVQSTSQEGFLGHFDEFLRGRAGTTGENAEPSDLPRGLPRLRLARRRAP